MPVLFAKVFRWGAYIVIVATLITFFSSCQQEAVVLYGHTFEQLRDSAQKTGANFCIVLSRPDCPPCKDFIESIGYGGQNGRFRNTFFSIVNVSLSENRWYTQWICFSGTPVTCVFSSAGDLTAVIAGASGPSLQCIQSALQGCVQCTDYFYDKYYTVANGDDLSLLNNLLKCKLDLDKDMDVGETLNTCLEQSKHPWAIYLKCLNEEKQGRRDEAIYWAKQLLLFTNIQYYYLYNDLYTEAKFIIDPNYIPEEEAALSVVEKVQLDDCKVGQPIPFALEVTNTGKVSLHIRDIRVSYTCVELFSPKQLTLNPGETKTAEFEFLAEKTGEVHREITFISDGANAVQQVRIEAHAN